MENTMKMYITADEVAELLGVSRGYAYKVIRGLNDELKAKGFRVISGKVPRKYFQEKFYGMVVQKKGDDDMSITATELKINLGKYLMLAETEDIYITRNGKVVAKLSNPYQDRVDVAKSLFGVLSNDMTLEEAREERLNTI